MTCFVLYALEFNTIPFLLLYYPDIKNNFLSSFPHNKCMLNLHPSVLWCIYMQVNYRPVSEQRTDIPPGENIYNADPSKLRTRNYRKDSKVSLF